MKSAIVIDPVANTRATLIHQLSTLGAYSAVQYSSTNDIAVDSLSSDKFKGLILISLADGISSITQFMGNLRQLNDEACVITLGSNVSINDMRSLVEAGVDQILIRPFSGLQLKEKIEASEIFRKQIQKENLAKPTSAYFEARVEVFTDKFFRVALAGWLGENCELPELRGAQSDSTVFVDCDLLKGLNSIGIRLWLLWMKTLSTSGFIRFEFENLHSSLLTQSRAIKGMLPENSSVNSFYLRYWNEEIDEEREFRLSRGKDYSTDRMRIPKFKKSVVNGREVTFELDELTPQITHFFKGSVEIVES